MNDIAEIKWNLSSKTGTQIRKLNGGNLAPNIANEMAGSNIRKSFKELNLAFTRLHDAPLVNGGCRLVDISHIFPLFHLNENDPATMISAIPMIISQTVSKMQALLFFTVSVNQSTTP
ncbi:MAG: hypothetical protein IKB71_02745 [Lentisphaeria bacterium]|nr:hypothetical protein [Lentisphaeria bacterium]